MCIYGFHWNVDNCSVMEMIFAKYVHQIKNAELQTCLRLLKGQNFSLRLLLRKNYFYQRRCFNSYNNHHPSNILQCQLISVSNCVRDQDNILADEQHKQFLYLGVWAPWITILSMEY